MADKELEKCEEKGKKIEKKEEVAVEKAEAEVKVEKAEVTVTEEELLKAIESLEIFSKASKEIEEEEPEEKEEEEEEEEPEKKEEKEEKSFENFDDNDTLEKAIEVSPFLEALVNETSLALEAVGKDIGSLRKSETEFNDKYIETLKSLTEVVKGLHSEMKDFRKSTEDRLLAIEQTPVSKPKSILKAVEIKKSFNTGGEGGGESDLRTLPKRVIADALTKAVMDGKMRDTVLMAFEAEHNYGFTPEQEEIVKAYLPK